MTINSLSFTHRYIPALDPEAGPPLLLLHGTGGDENDLVDIGRLVAPGRALISPRGRVLENGMPRFFRRLAEGVFDEEDIVRRSGELAEFIGEVRALHHLAAPVALGFSNGANIAAAVLLLHPEALAGAILLRAMTPFKVAPDAALTGKSVLMLSGKRDPIVPADNAALLADILRRKGAAVEHQTLEAGHQLSQADLTLSGNWLAAREAVSVA
ncbi:phospholipase/carboxylesterase [Rhodoligotrophos appendicifer]|uniref:alpha/beta hydrolase n=1 Tax=Rhodoligotrophos appendicifer TaxID=987056 RepID=UPI0011813E81|nr:alpha/beta hydrolase [Rhodoligotrophos appendicifer]